MNEDLIPEAYHPIIRRLRKAMEDSKKQGEMEPKDDIIHELHDWELQIEKMHQTIADNAKTIAELKKNLLHGD